ncbi:MAG TPA: ERF family protein [Candidatus Absconditabacterales bacterium]|nr:ERF family protein [Candidatus Absconditabacterales bacterium]
MSIYKKLLKIQGMNLSVSKDATNPHFKSKYMDLDSIIEVFSPVLAKEGILIFNRSESSILYTSLYDTESDTSVTSEFAINNSDPQKRGAEITYGRRYNLQQLLNIQAEDDDGNKASGDTKEEDNKPWFSQANLEALAKVMDRFGSIDECIKSARDKYKVSNKAKEAIIHAYNTGEITKI